MGSSLINYNDDANDDENDDDDEILGIAKQPNLQNNPIINNEGNNK